MSLLLAGKEPETAGKSDHGAVVGAKFGSGKKKFGIFPAAHIRKASADRLVCAHPSSRHQAFDVRLSEGAATLDGKGVGHCVLKTPGDVCLILGGSGGGGEGVESKRLEPAEAEVETGPAAHGAGESETLRISFPSQFFQRRSPGIAEVEHLGHFVEGFSHGVINGFSKQPVFSQPSDFDQKGVAAGDQQGKEWRL